MRCYTRPKFPRGNLSRHFRTSFFAFHLIYASTILCYRLSTMSTPRIGAQIRALLSAPAPLRLIVRLNLSLCTVTFLSARAPSIPQFCSKASALPELNVGALPHPLLQTERILLKYHQSTSNDELRDSLESSESAVGREPCLTRAARSPQLVEYCSTFQRVTADQLRP